jgi:hypothetical protein
MHQRSCQVLHGLNRELCADVEEQIADISAEDQPSNTLSTLVSAELEEILPDLKKGVYLPKKDSERKTANHMNQSHHKISMQVSGI